LTIPAQHRSDVLGIAASLIDPTMRPKTSIGSSSTGASFATGLRRLEFADGRRRTASMMADRVVP
jgi:hypothetical protein